ncbi:hypothetical protein QN277_025758 [Acacia crassicarpa]|uniref:Uncharacterized protein n=1 Tax=Acacia crassicarpa TaxID=499986 RepID=A0AAE1K5J8_9FABA|nr:hypothetical protein QN277_025758 [Acacia crassicarpa]
MEEYLYKMKNLVDELSLASSPVAMGDLILHTLNGLDAEYNAVVVKLVDKLDLTWIEAHGAMLSFESRLSELNHFSNLSTQPSMNAAQRSDVSNIVYHGSGNNCG